MSKYNVVFLPIGDKQCGDALAIRVWDDQTGKENIVLIDGGYKDDWKKVEDIVNLPI